MDPIATIKELEQAQTPLLLLDFTFADGTGRHWATHAVTYAGQAYEARVLRHNAFEVQAMSAQGIDQIPRLAVTLANADGQMSQLDSAKGFKGATVLARFIFHDLTTGECSPDSLVIFSGYCNPPSEISDLELKVTALNRMNLQRVVLPPVKIQRRCPWSFPATAQQRQSGVFDPNSPCYPCGYSPDIAGGRGRPLPGGDPYTWCDYTRQACVERGMFNHDAATTLAQAAAAGATSIVVNQDIASIGDAINVGGSPDPKQDFGTQEEVRVAGKQGAGPFTLTLDRALAHAHALGDAVGRPTRRFGGIEYVPETIDVRPFGSRFYVKSPVHGSAARYNDHIPTVYGTAWVEPVVTVLRNDGNLTRMEAIASLGRISGIRRVVVNDFEIPEGVAGRNMTGSGWYNIVTDGGIYGGFDLNFTDGEGNPQGDPYGSMAYLFIAVPNAVNDGKSVPRVQALIDGRLLERFDAGGNSLGFAFTNNTAWVLLDLLKMSRWRLDQLDLPSFAEAAAYCDETIAATDNYGNPVMVPRFQCNLVLNSRRSAAEVIQGVRNNARLFFTYSGEGKLQARVENTIALQQPSLPYGSNATQPVAGGWPAYVYSGTGGNLVRRPDGASSVRVFQRSISDTPNRVAFEFQDSFNEYVQDSFAMDDLDDQAVAGQEISQTLVVDGIPSFEQAARVSMFHLDKAVLGNLFVEFETSVKALGQQVGQIIAITYAREGWDNRLFRILKIAPRLNFHTVQITAQTHDDAWYSDDAAGTAGRAPRQPRRNPRVPNPLIGIAPRGDGDWDWAITEKRQSESDGAGIVELQAAFAVPVNSFSRVVGSPSADLGATVETSGGAIPGGQTLYYRITARDSEGLESAPSFAIRAVVPEGSNLNRVTMTGLRFDASTAGFDVYRGASPSKMGRIANNQAPAANYVDIRADADPVALPDPYFDHARFYWKRCVTSPALAGIHSPSSIGNSGLELTPDEWKGYLVRIHSGTGAEQVRRITTHTDTTLSVSPPWTIEPDAGSVFLVEEPDWKFGSAAASSPASFRVPNQAARLLIAGRAADERNSESPEAMAAITTWQVGGVGPGVTDTGTPPAPVFGISVPRDGTLVLSPVTFASGENTRGVRAVRYRVYYADEIGPVATSLLQAAGETDESVVVASPAGFEEGDFAVLGSEVVEIQSIAANTWTVARGCLGTAAAAHGAGTRLDRLVSRLFSYTFEPGFFAQPDCGQWSASLALPCARITSVLAAAANAFGEGQVSTNNYLVFNSDPGSLGSLPGLRTNRGGQFAFQVGGRLAIENDPVPALPVHLTGSVRDIYAFVAAAPAGGAIAISVKRNGVLFQLLSIAAGQTVSGVVSGAALDPVQASDRLGFDITSVGATEPGADLTLVVRV